MKLLNSISDRPFEDNQARLFVMPVDCGAWFGIVHETGGILSIIRSHFQPWGNGQTVFNVLDQDIVAVLTSGCEAMVDDRNIATVLQSACIGTSPIQFKDVCVCVPAAWSTVVRGRQKSLHTASGARRKCFTTRTSAGINAANLTELAFNSRCLCCADALATYQLDQEQHWRQNLNNQHYNRLTCQTDFFMVERDKYELIRKALECVRKYDTQITWTSDLCTLSHLDTDPDTVLIDLDKFSARIHRNAGSDASSDVVEIHPADLFSALKKRAGELPLGLDAIELDYAASCEKEFHRTIDALPGPLKDALPATSKIFWAGLLELLQDKQEPQAAPRKLALIGDCALTLHSLMTAANESGWETSALWPQTRIVSDPSKTESARVAVRALESFHRRPFEDFPVAHIHWHRANRLMKTATSDTVKRICALLM